MSWATFWLLFDVDDTSSMTDSSFFADSYANQLNKTGAVSLRNNDGDVLEDLRDMFRGTGRAQLPLEWQVPRGNGISTVL